MAYSQKYTIVQFKDPISVGTRFDMKNWPLHITLANVIAIDATDQAFDQLHKAMSTISSFSVAAGEDIILGAINATKIKDNGQLQALHDTLVDTLLQNGATFAVPEYSYSNFLPHVTIQDGLRVYSDERLGISEISIVDMFHEGDWKQRKVVQNISLS